MKEYKTPIMEELLLEAEDVITASGDATNSIVSAADQAASSETQESSWNDSWN